MYGYHSIKIKRSGRFIMNLFQSHWKNVVCFVRLCLLVSLPIFLVGCVSSPVQQATIEQIESSTDGETEITEPEPLPLTAELVYYILTAEIAGQRGDMGTAVDLYHQASILEDSSAVASRSAQIALFARDQQRIHRALDRWLEVDSANANIYILQIPFLIAKGDYDGVVTAMNTALDLMPDEAKNYLAQLSNNLNERADPERALAALQQLNLYKNNDPEALFAYARSAAIYKHYEDALPAIEAVLKQQADREDALIIKAEVLQRLDKGDAALAVLKTPASKETAGEDLRFAYAKLLGENNKIAQARTVFEQLHTELPDNEEVIFALGLLALEEKDGQLAKKYFHQLVKLGDQGHQAAYFMGLSEELNNNIEQALIWYVSVPAKSQRFQPAQSRYINLLADNDQLDKARLHLQLLRKEQPDRAVQYYLFEASFLRERNKDQAAFDLYGEALAEYPNNIDLLYSRAMVAEPLNRLAVLEADLNNILAQNPNDASALNALGYTLADRTDRHQEALAMILKAVEIQPNDPFYLDSLGWVYYRLGNLDKAVRYLKQAVAIQDDPEFLAHLGEVLWQQGQQSEAKRVWQQAFQKDADNELLRKTMRRFGQ